MIAYNGTGLDNRTIQEEVQEAFASGCITGDEKQQIKSAYPDKLYTPNGYIRVGLFILTVIIVSFSLGLLALITSAVSDKFSAFMIISGLLCYGSLEYLIRKKNHFKSGADEALMWMAAFLLFFGIYLGADPISWPAQCIAIFVLSLFFALRFADRIMSLLAFAALLAILFNSASNLGTTGKALMPFIIMAAAGILYFLCNGLYAANQNRHYRSCLTTIKAAALLSFYLAGNYLVVREMSILMFDLPQQAGPAIPMGWLFKTLTVITPLAYIYQGLRKKDNLFLWVGLILSAATVYTFWHYYAFLSTELAITISGALLITIAYAVTKYLKTSRQGFTNQAKKDNHFIETLHLESLVIAETFTPIVPAGNDTQFGGGSGGGAGADGQF